MDHRETDGVDTSGIPGRRNNTISSLRPRHKEAGKRAGETKIASKKRSSRNEQLTTKESVKKKRMMMKISKEVFGPGV